MTDRPKPSGSDRVLHERRPSLQPRYVQPVVVKQGSVFLLCTNTGDILPDSDQGLYFHDMRYLSAEALRIDDQPPVSLLADAGEGHAAVFELTNPDLTAADGSVRVHKETLGIRREKRLGNTYTELIAVHNYGRDPVTLSLSLRVAADFADMFVVRGTRPGRRGRLRHPRWRGRTLELGYDGADGHERRSRLRFSRSPDERDGGEVTFAVALGGRAQWELTITCDLLDTAPAGSGLEARPRASEGPGQHERQRARTGGLGGPTRLETDNQLFNSILGRSFMDLHMLRMRQRDQPFFAAGVPWYVALFGRDSLVTALQVAAFDRDIGANTLRVLAAYQGTKVDDWRDEQPGKILHELRVDEMANLDEIPQTPYFGSVDSTPLFLVLLGVYSAWEGTLDLFHELRDSAAAALDWLERYADSDGDGFVDYQCRSERGGRNQGWKDSGNGIVMQDGALAEPPIALPEVQGDVYLAWRLMAALYERDGDSDSAARLRHNAERLCEAFNRAFWLGDAEYLAFCRQGDGQFSRSIASNGAHTLWTGIVEPGHARAVVRRVLRPDMFSGWGVRTLSADDPSYNPIDYQVGSIWPHDNSFIVAGMQRYGFGEEAATVFTAIVQAAAQFEHFRLPEVFAGYDKSDASRPVAYPVACNPQAWAAGAVPYMLAASLGLRPDAWNHRLRIVRPHLPSWLREVTVRGLRVGQADVELHFERTPRGTLVAVGRKSGELTVATEW